MKGNLHLDFKNIKNTAVEREVDRSALFYIYGCVLWLLFIDSVVTEPHTYVASCGWQACQSTRMPIDRSHIVAV